MDGWSCTLGCSTPTLPFLNTEKVNGPGFVELLPQLTDLTESSTGSTTASDRLTSLTTSSTKCPTTMLSRPPRPLRNFWDPRDFTTTTLPLSGRPCGALPRHATTLMMSVESSTTSLWKT